MPEMKTTSGMVNPRSDGPGELRAALPRLVAALHIVAGTSVLAIGIVAEDLAAGDLELVERGAAAEEEEAVHEGVECPWPPVGFQWTSPAVVWAAGDAEGTRGTPEVAPALAKHACPDGIVGGEEEEDVVEDLIGERADVILAAAGHRNGLIRHGAERDES
nr:unnamed protein product [Digitaria exilis]